MLLTAFEQEVYLKLQGLGLCEEFPYIENCLEQKADSMEEVFFHAICSYQTFQPIVQHNHHYSENELKLLGLIAKYQTEMKAYYSNFNSKRKITVDEISSLTHLELKDILNKANRKHRGIYYISTLKGYSSTTLYENPIHKSNMIWTGTRWHNSISRHRIFGKLSSILPETMRLYDNTLCSFEYPYLLQGKEYVSSSIYEVYDLACEYSELELLRERKYYSGQQKRIVKKLKHMSAKGFDT